MTEILEQEEKRGKRPVFLTVLCILSFISIGWTFIGNVLSIFRGPMGEEEMTDFKVEMTRSINEMRNSGAGLDWLEDFMRSIIDMVESTNANHTLSILSGLVIILVGFAGVFFMLKGKKLGFHFYIIYSILASVQIYLFVNPSMLSNLVVIVNLFISGIFVLLYGLNLKWMR